MRGSKSSKVIAGEGRNARRVCQVDRYERRGRRERDCFEANAVELVEVTRRPVVSDKRGRVVGIGGDDGDVVVALCGYRVPPAQAHAWAKALLSAVDAEVVVALTSVVVEPGRSEGWEGARLLATSEAEERGDCLEVREGEGGRGRRGKGDLKVHYWGTCHSPLTKT